EGDAGGKVAAGVEDGATCGPHHKLVGGSSLHDRPTGKGRCIAIDERAVLIVSAREGSHGRCVGTACSRVRTHGRGNGAAGGRTFAQGGGWVAARGRSTAQCR